MLSCMVARPRGWPGVGLRYFVLVCLLHCTACISPRGRALQTRPEPLRTLTLDIDLILSPPLDSVQLEIRRLRQALLAGDRSGISRTGRFAGMLRIAALHQSMAQHETALQWLAQLERRSPPAGPKARALAHILRSASYVQLGQLDNARAELALAESLAVDRVSRNEIARRRFAIAKPVKKLAPALVKKGSKKAKAGRRAKVHILRRSEWGSRAAMPRKMYRMGKPERITVHHSAMHLGNSSSEAIRQIRSIQRSHIRGKGWGDIGYHFLLDRSGRIIEGRDLRYQGAHAGDRVSNRRNIGICLLGNFHAPTGNAQYPSKAQIQSLDRLIHALTNKYSISVNRVYTHKEIHPDHATECPGSRLTNAVRRLRNRMRETGE